MNAYPSLKQGFGIFGICIGVTLVSALVFMALQPYLGESATSFLIYVTAMGGTFLIANAIRTKQNGTANFNLEIKDKSLLPLIGLITIALPFGVTVPIASLIPLDDFTRQIFLKLAQQKGVFPFLTIVIAAPILEELIFRGIILDGFLKRYNPIKAIFLSSLLFGIVHLNPIQFVTALIAGSFMGWIYYRTKSLALTIFIHALNNLISFIGTKLMPTTPENIDEPLIETYGGLMPMISVTAIGIMVTCYGIYLLNKKMNGAIFTDVSEPTFDEITVSENEAGDSDEV